jgi:hypothetical protein
MKTIHPIAQLFGAAAVSCLAIATASAQDVLGTWSCAMMSEDPSGEGSVNMEFEATFSADGTDQRAGEMNIVMQALQVDTSFSFTEAGSWTRNAMVLTTAPSEIGFESSEQAPSQIEQMIAQQIQAAAQNSPEQTLTIKSLTATTMTVDSEGEETTCQRA